MKSCFSFILVFICTFGLSQERNATTAVDSLFREDQFYFSVSYNLLQNRPKGFKQYSFSPALTAGFLRDFPISKNRHWSIAPGIGYAYNDAKQLISEKDLLGTGSATDIIRTRVIFHQLEFPIEFRWRNATPDSHKFWRVYGGFKASYVFSGQLILEDASGRDKFDVTDELTKWQFGAYIAAGYNTWNPYIYYGLDPIFKNGSKLSSFNVGLKFYIL